MRDWIGASALAAILFNNPTPAHAQDLADEISDAAAFANIGKGFQSLAVLGQTPGVGNTRLESERVDLNSGRLHLAHRFVRRDADQRALPSPFAEVTLGRASADERIEFARGRPDDFRLDLRYKSRSILFGGGVAIPLGVRTTVTPILLAGHSVLRINSKYRGADEAQFLANFDGLLDDARIKSFFVGGAVSTNHHRRIFKDSKLTLTARYNHFFNISDNVTDRGLKPRGTAGLATAAATIQTPTRIYWGERELFASTFVRGTALTGSGRDFLGFDRYGEVGGRLIFDYPTSKGIGFGFFGSLARGPDVKGHSLGITLTFAGARLLNAGA